MGKAATTRSLRDIHGSDVRIVELEDGEPTGREFRAEPSEPTLSPVIAVPLAIVLVPLVLFMFGMFVVEGFALLRFYSH